jgi:hypothetical protein
LPSRPIVEVGVLEMRPANVDDRREAPSALRMLPPSSILLALIQPAEVRMHGMQLPRTKARD